MLTSAGAWVQATTALPPLSLSPVVPSAEPGMAMAATCGAKAVAHKGPRELAGPEAKAGKEQRQCLVGGAGAPGKEKKEGTKEGIGLH